MRTQKKKTISKLLRQLNIPFEFMYVKKKIYKKCGCYLGEQTFRHAIVKGSVFNIYFTYNHKDTYIRMRSDNGYVNEQFHEVNSRTSNLLEKAYKFANDQVAFDEQLRIEEEERLAKIEEAKRFNETLYEIGSGKKAVNDMYSFVSREDVENIKNWDNLTRSVQIKYRNRFFFNKKLNQLYIDFITGKLQKE